MIEEIKIWNIFIIQEVYFDIQVYINVYVEMGIWSFVKKLDKVVLVYQLRFVNSYIQRFKQLILLQQCLIYLRFIVVFQLRFIKNIRRFYCIVDNQYGVKGVV